MNTKISTQENLLQTLHILESENERMHDILDKIIDEIKKWYWQADKQAIAKDPCVVDAMIDLFIRTIKKYKEDKEGAEE